MEAEIPEHGREARSVAGSHCFGGDAPHAGPTPVHHCKSICQRCHILTTSAPITLEGNNERNGCLAADMVLRIRRSKNSLNVRGSFSGHCGRFLVECRPQNPFHTHDLVLILADGSLQEPPQARVCTTRLGPQDGWTPAWDNTVQGGVPYDILIIQ